MTPVLDNEELQGNLLDLLLDGPSSFAALYGGLVRHYCYPKNLSLNMMMNSLIELGRRDYVKTTRMSSDGRFNELTENEQRSTLPLYQAWLPVAEFEELSVDEVGLWYGITPKGREKAKRRSIGEEPGNTGRWTLDDLAETQTILIRADSEEGGEERLRWWLLLHPEIIPMDGSKTVKPISEFRLRDGTVIVGGVELSIRYRRAPN